MSHSHKHDKKKTSNSDNLDDIIAMSNDDDIKKRRNKNDDSDDEENDSDDEEDEENNDDDIEDKKKRRKIKKINDDSDDDETDDDDYTVPKIKAKKAKPHRQSDFTKEEISEIKKSKAVEDLGNRLNNNLHQIQIALPYDQQPPKYVENNQQMIP